MLQQFIFALVMASATVVIHAVGTVFWVMPAAGVWSRRLTGHKPSRAILPLIRLTGALLVLHLAEMTLWGAAYAAAGVLPDFESSLYYSLESYTTLGYGDVLPPTSWRLLGPIEASVGVLMLGWSTGIIVAAVQYIYKTKLIKV